MEFPLPSSFSPSSLSQFTICPLAYRFSYIEKRYQPPQVSATKGSIVHRALELMFLRNPTERNLDNTFRDLDIAFEEYEKLPDLVDLNLDPESYSQLKKEAKQLIENYFLIENPQKINPIGLEIKLEAKFDETILRGIIDRLELDENGDLIVTDYKSGSVPPVSAEQARLSGVHLYALLCEQIFGKRPAKVQLLYLSKPTYIIATPNTGSIKGVEIKSKAIHKAVVRACDTGDFRPKESVLCNWCGYQDLCPAKGGVLPDEKT